MARLIAVCGATGKQGSSVIRFLLQDGGFSICGLTRNPNSATAKELTAKGVEVVEADFSKPETLRNAFKGAYGVFAVTNFWETLDGETETKQGKALVDAAKAEGVKHYIWSTLEDPKPIKVAHWSSKAKVDEYLIKSGVLRTSLYTSMYYENFTYIWTVNKDENGDLVANWPLAATDGPAGAYAVEDTGAWVLQAFKHPEEWIGKDLKVAGEIITPRQVAKTLSELSGKPIKLVEVSMEAFDAIERTKETEELWTNMKWFYMNDGNPGRDLEFSKKLYPGVQTFKMWAEKHYKECIRD